MNKMIVIVMTSSLMLAACSAAPTDAKLPGTGGKLPPMTELVIGTLKLDGTAEAVTKEQATELLPLWEVYKQLSSSDTAAAAEISGLTQQIQSAMTDAQRKSISSMKLTQQDVMAVIQQQAPNMAVRPSGGGTTTGPGGNTGPGGGFPGGGPPGGGTVFVGPDGGGFPGGGGSAGGTQIVGTPRAPASQRNASQAGVPTPLVNALIEYLKKKAAS